MKRKFIVFSGHVESKNDGETHYLSAEKVCRLYGLNPNAPNVRLADIRRPETFLGCDDSYIRLFPRSDGNYKIEEER
ncbi:MAG: hypothetical protein DRP08_03940 [Candidatus Aenigmatarchaeota archaeon]|nr:MAG: hypothetical protein DRP08_03940 [Candidatus Aenigmarchaeota archaeon]